MVKRTATGAWFLRRGVQRVLAGATLVVLAISHTLLSRLPLPLESADVGAFDAGPQAEIVIDQVLAQRGPLLVFEGQIGDAVDLRIDRARLQSPGIKMFSQLGVRLPAGDVSMSLLTREADDAKTFFRIEVVPEPGQASRISLTSPREAGDTNAALILRTTGAQLAITVLSVGQPMAGALPERSLRLAGTTVPLSGALPLSFVAAAGSEVRLRIVPTQQAWDAAPRLALAPADLQRAARTITGIGVKPLRAAPFSDYACAAPSPLPLLRPAQLARGACPHGASRLELVGLSFRPGSLRAEVTGQAWVRKDNAVHTLDLLGWLTQNPILAALIAALDAAALAWAKRAFSRQPSIAKSAPAPAEKPHPHSPPEAPT